MADLQTLKQEVWFFALLCTPKKDVIVTAVRTIVRGSKLKTAKIIPQILKFASVEIKS